MLPQIHKWYDHMIDFRVDMNEDKTSPPWVYQSIIDLHLTRIQNWKFSINEGSLKVAKEPPNNNIIIRTNLINNAKSLSHANIITAVFFVWLFPKYNHFSGKEQLNNLDNNRNP